VPVVWAGVTGKTKVLFVGIPLAPSGSRLPFVASFPVLMRNALLWMLPSVEIRHPGDRVAGWTSRRVGRVESPVDGATHAFSVLSTAESDLRRAEPAATEPIPRRRPVAGVLIALAIVLLSVDFVSPRNKSRVGPVSQVCDRMTLCLPKVSHLREEAWRGVA